MTPIASLFTWRRGTVLVVAITGELDISNARELEAAIVAELGDAGLVVDLGGLTFLDAAGVHLLQRLRDRGRPLAIVASEDSPPRRVLELTGESWLFATEDEALARVAHAGGDAGDGGQ
jgi:anti-anti-sigma factor